jgi:hypothetical protein
VRRRVACQGTEGGCRGRGDATSGAGRAEGGAQAVQRGGCAAEGSEGLEAVLALGGGHFGRWWWWLVGWLVVEFVEVCCLICVMFFLSFVDVCVCMCKKFSNQRKVEPNRQGVEKQARM